MSRPELPTPNTDLAACRKAICQGSRSFWLASKLLPGALRRPAFALYAFCRDADDAIDNAPDPAAALPELYARLDRIYAEAGRPVSAADRLLAETVRHHHLPRALLDALIEGFTWDASGRRYQSHADLMAYCARVAGSVGVMMSVLMGVREANALARAADLGVAMQLTNIARDIGEDARNGRLYLPTAWLAEAGLDADQFLANPQPGAALARVVTRLLAEAETLYRRADAGIACLPGTCRPGIHAASRIYADIGRQVVASGCDSINQRAVVSTGRKLTLLLRAFALPPQHPNDLSLPPLVANRFLIEAVAQTPVVAPPLVRQPRPDSLPQRLLWMLKLLEAMDTRAPAHRDDPAGRVRSSRDAAFETVTMTGPSHAETA